MTTNEHPEPDDELTGIFDALTPEDFRTSQVHEGEALRADFEAFVAAQLLLVHATFAAAETEPSPVAALENDRVVRLYVPTDDENMGEYLDRLRGEAELIGAHRIFVSRTTAVAVAEVPADLLHDGGDTARQAEMLAAGLVEDGLVWYAADTRGGRALGTFVIDGLSLVRPVRGSARQPYAMFDRVLDTGPPR